MELPSSSPWLFPVDCNELSSFRLSSGLQRALPICEHIHGDMEDAEMCRNNYLYMEEEDVYGNEQQSELEKNIQSDAAELEPQLEDVCIETQQSFAKETQYGDVEGKKDTSDFEASNDQHPKDSNEAQTPYIGMNFLNWEEAYSFYNTYAQMKGFRVRIGRTDVSRKIELDGSSPKVFSKRFVCYKEGYRSEDKRQKGKKVRHRPEVRVGCPAFLCIKPNSNGWVVHKFEADHNHPLVLEDKSIRLRSHQQLTNGVKLIVDNLHGSGIGQSQTQIVDAVMECFGGYNNIDVTKGALKGQRNERKMIEVDLQTVLAYFESMKEKDPGFVYSINVSDKQTLSAIFWIDGKGKSDYEIFSDIVVFDTTYNKNRYRWPFGAFIGVNHHAQSILFGCGLVADKTKESLEWLFKAWLNAMGDKAPKAIITDECTGIISAVASVFPKTVHRFCSWHVSKNALQHLGPLWFQKPEFKSEWKQCVYHSWSEADFLTQWEAMMVKHNLKDHSWLNEKFAQRKFWVPCYFRGTFFAGMSSTQRSEGMDSYFQGYFNGSMTLLSFVKQYERVVAKHREKEANAESKSLVNLPQLESQSPIEMHGRQVYTRRVFEIFKKNFSASLSLSAVEESFGGSIRKFKVGPFNVPVEHRCVVEYNSIDEEIHCSCLMFEFVGIPCKHFLKVLQMVDRDSMPSKYILSRWTKEAKYGLTL